MLNGSHNTNTATQTTTFVSQVAGTVSASYSVTLEASAQVAIFFEVKGSVTASATQSASVTVGNQVSFALPAHMFAYAAYGVWITTTTGTLYHYSSDGCTVTASTVTSTFPTGTGWDTWISAT